MISDLKRLIVKGVPKATVEIDSQAGAVYIRFRDAKVSSTVADDSRGTVVTFDLDRNGQLIGIELVGVKDFSLREFRRAVPELKRVDLEGARLAPTPA